jgi:hypothetical protein
MELYSCKSDLIIEEKQELELPEELGKEDPRV